MSNGRLNSLFVMDQQKAFISYLFVVVMSRAWTELPPPQNIEIKSSVLLWDPPRGENNLTYTVQFSNVSEGSWHNVCGCNQPHFDFRSAAEDFYWKIFRVQAESANQTSSWRQSELVKCQHIDTCAPILNVKVETDRVHLWMLHRDESVKEEFQRHISFRVLCWKETTPNNKKEHNDINGSHLIIESLESGQKYCFQAEYVAYNKPYGSPSQVRCEVIPETSAERGLRIILSGVLTVVGLAIFGTCLYFVYNNYKRIKIFLQPPLEIPVHFQEFFSGEFSQSDHVSFETQEVESNELITFSSEEIRDEYESRRNVGEISSFPDMTT